MNYVPSIVRENGARFLCMYIINLLNINIMARKVINEKGFKIIGLTPDECFAIGFGFNDMINPQLICDNCNKLINVDKEVYYIPVLNRVFCKECLTDWYCTAKYYPEDAYYEALKYDTISNYIKEFNGEIKIENI